MEKPDFDFPKDVSAKATSDLSAALKANNGQQMIDALVRYGIAECSISAENFPAVINKIESVLKKEQRPDFKALLLCLEAKMLEPLLHEAPFRDIAEGPRPADISEWGRDDFKVKIAELISDAVADKDALRKCLITNYSDIITFNDLGALYCPTLYDFLLREKEELSTTGTEIEKQTEYLLQSGNIPAYLYAKVNSLDSKEKLQLYEKYCDNEHSGMLLTRLSNDANSYKAFQDNLNRHPKGLYSYGIRTKV